MKQHTSLEAKRLDVLVLILLITMAFFYNTLVANTYLGKALLGGVVFIVPSIIYLGARQPKPWRKIFIATLIFGGLFGFFFEFIQEYTGTYLVVSRVFPKLFGILPPDNVLGHMMVACLTFTFYEHFVNRNSTATINPRMSKVAYASLGVVFAEISLYIVHPSLLAFHYSYAYLGLAAIVPIAYLLLSKPEYTRDILMMIPFFFLLYLAVEIIAVKYSWWIYPGYYYIGWVTLFDQTFPFEELFFWMFFYAAALISYYKLTIDRPVAK
jgi:hypothetical protein